MEQRPLADRVAAVSALDEPIRRALFDQVSRSDTPVSRDDAAEAVGLARSTAAFHLDRLVAPGISGWARYAAYLDRAARAEDLARVFDLPRGAADRRPAERAWTFLGGDIDVEVFETYASGDIAVLVAVDRQQGTAAESAWRRSCPSR